MKDVKNVKVATHIHKELKIFIAKNDKENMVDVAGLAIMEYLKSRGHKFLKK